jgi:hypothetical protein
MIPAFDLSFHSDDVPVLVGSSQAIAASHAPLEQALAAQSRTADYGNGYNFAIEETDPTCRLLYSMVLESMNRLHRVLFGKEVVLSPRNQRTCWALVLDETRPTIDVWHNHVRTATYNGVYYLRTTGSDALHIIVPDDRSDPRHGRELTIPVQEGTLLVIPGWLFHKPNSIQSQVGRRRISINMEIITAS